MGPAMSAKFTEEETEHFYDTEDAHYRTFWDRAGSLHWGIFDDSTGNDFLKACANLNNIMARKGLLDASSQVIDLGCGNGNISIWLARATGCQVLGVDLSGVRVQNARHALEKEADKVQLRVRFEKASVTNLPFEDESFTHAWSQATIYHVPDKEKALREAYRVLQSDGVFVFDDLIKPKQEITDTARKYVYDRLLFDTDYSFKSYQESLRRVGFQIVDATDLSAHLGASYARLAELAGQTVGDNEAHFKELSFAYRQMVKCIESQELGWAMYVCRK